MNLLPMLAVTGTQVAQSFGAQVQPAALTIGGILLGILTLWFFFAHLGQAERGGGFRAVVLETAGIMVLGAVILYVINTLFL